MNIAEKAIAAQAHIKQAEEVKAAAERAARDAFYAATKESHTFLRELQERYEELAFDIACEKGIPPYYRSGSRKRPCETTVRDEGLHLVWHDDYDFRSHTVTWAELQAAEEAEGA